MNTRLFTGYLPADCAEAWTPASLNRPNEPRLVFDCVIKDSHGTEFPEKCVVEELPLVKEYKPLLTAGRAVIIQGEQTARPWHKAGVLMGWVREVRVQRIEFPNRARTQGEEPKHLTNTQEKAA